MGMFGFYMRANKETFMGEGIMLYAFEKKNDSIVAAARPLIVEAVIDEGVCPPPFCHLGAHQAQILMDDLWNCGVRPSEGTGSAGSLAATQKHLSDLKKILFHKIGIKE